MVGCRVLGWVGGVWVLECRVGCWVGFGLCVGWFGSSVARCEVLGVGSGVVLVVGWSGWVVG